MGEVHQVCVRWGCTAVVLVRLLFYFGLFVFRLMGCLPFGKVGAWAILIRSGFFFLCYFGAGIF